ncbi:hypothetical protein CYMTET_3820 [Cymbomonas tetramitiformis]|uniref:MIR domain-containing protein n=1 Tax=Cymbomonas tetramitiformis TaxID=36881 RepID=A0AAE0H2E6_9CHLO|nr:hypothetical protein CYMTET_3820 [Cymbomonas tetramitiformis]
MVNCRACVLEDATLEKGYANAAGWADKKLRVDILTRQCDLPPFLADCQFEIRTKRQYAALKALKKWALTAGGRRMGGVATPVLSLQATERSVNEAEYLRSIGNIVNYGDVIQLRHLGTGEYVTIKKERAEQDRQCMRVVLQKDGDEGSWLQVMPAYRGKSEGDPVMLDDTVTLSFSKYPASNLHMSELRAQSAQAAKVHHYVLERRELNAFNEPSTFNHLKFRPYGVHPTMMDSDASDCLKGGDAVMIRHRATETALVYKDGEVKFEYWPEPTAGAIPTSAALWKLESAGIIWAGMPVRSAVPVRIKHIATLKYLCTPHLEVRAAQEKVRLEKMEEVKRMQNLPSVIPEAPSNPTHAPSAPPAIIEHEHIDTTLLGLTYEYMGESTLWQYHLGKATHMQEEEERKPVPASALVFCKNTHSQWLSEEMDLDDTRPPELQDRLAVLADENLDKDALSLEVMPGRFVATLLKECSSITVLQRFTQQIRDEVENVTEGVTAEDENAKNIILANTRACGLKAVLNQHGELVQSTVDRIIAHLEELAEGNKVDESLESYQRVLMEQDSIASVMDILEVLFREKSLPHWALERRHIFGFDLMHLCRLCVNFLALVCRHNRMVKDYIITKGWLPLLQDLLGSNVKSSVAISEIYHENELQIQRVGHAEVQRYVKLLLNDRHSRYLHFLEVICKYKSVPLPRNQNMVVTALLLDPGPDSNLLLDARVQLMSVSPMDLSPRPEAVNSSSNPELYSWAPKGADPATARTYGEYTVVLTGMGHADAASVDCVMMRHVLDDADKQAAKSSDVMKQINTFNFYIKLLNLFWLGPAGLRAQGSGLRGSGMRAAGGELFSELPASGEEPIDGGCRQVMPAYRGKSEGDPVMLDDTVTLSFSKYPASNLHMSELRAQSAQAAKVHHYVLERRELNAFNEPSTFNHLKFRPYGVHPTMMDSDASDCLKGGDAVMIRHRATETALVYKDGEVKFEYWPEPTAGAIPTSAALWKLESAGIIWAGMPVRSAVPVRIKHIATLKYLCTPHLEVRAAQEKVRLEKMEEVKRMQNLPSVIPEAPSNPTHAPSAPPAIIEHEHIDTTLLGLTYEYMGESTLWQYHLGKATHMQEEEERKPVPASALVFCKNTHSQWLSEEMDLDDTRPPELQDRLAVLADENLDKDALSLEVMPGRFVATLLKECSSITVLQRFTQQIRDEVENVTEGVTAEDENAKNIILANTRACGLKAVLNQHGELVQSTVDRIIAHLEELAEGNKVDESLESYQRVLMEQDSIASVMDILEVLFREKSLPHWALERRHIFGFDLMHLCRLCVNFLALVCRHNRMVKDYIITKGWLPLLQDLLGSNVKSSVAISEIYHENELQIQRVGHAEVQRYVKLLLNDRHSRYLHFLEVICKYKSVPLPRNQNMVVTALLLDPGPDSNLLLDARVQLMSVSPMDLSPRPEAVNSSSNPELYSWAPKGADPATARTYGEYTVVLTGMGHADAASVDCVMMRHVLDDADKQAAKSSDVMKQINTFNFYIKLLNLFSSQLGKLVACQALKHQEPGCLSFKIRLKQTELATVDVLLSQADRFAIGFGELQLMAFHPHMPNALRTAAVQLLINLYIDQEPNVIKISPLELTRVHAPQAGGLDVSDLGVWSLPTRPSPTPEELSAPTPPPELGPSHLSPDSISQLRKQVMTSLSAANGQVDVADSSRNALVLALVQLTHLLLQMGMMGSLCEPDHILGDLTDILLNLLDGRRDIGVQEREDVSGLQDAREAIIVEMKAAICVLLQYTFDMRVNRRLDIMFNTFEHLHATANDYLHYNVSCMRRKASSFSPADTEVVLSKPPAKNAIAHAWEGESPGVGGGTLQKIRSISRSRSGDFPPDTQSNAEAAEVALYTKLFEVPIIGKAVHDPNSERGTFHPKAPSPCPPSDPLSNLIPRPISSLRHLANERPGARGVDARPCAVLASFM